ncbi:hypothetical protein ANO11243_025310 [Dothideomycetidae sp. 11243]|nr:hypothetical protein ANO11243_025310 [fungal sp. No.11243]
MALPFSTLRHLATTLLVSSLLYFSFLISLAASPSLQAHVLYLHSVGKTWLRNATEPEHFGFLPGQVTPFHFSTSDGESLHAWHILPLATYLTHQTALIAGNQTRTILADDPDAFLVIYFHGTAGNLASGWRPPGYRALSAGDPERIHVLAFDYRGFGLSSSTPPTEPGLVEDGIAAVRWALDAGAPASRIVLYGQSLGAAVALGTAARMADYDFAGLVLTAGFADVRSLTATYRVIGVLPLLAPIARFPALVDFFNGYLTSTWRSADRLAEYVRVREGRGGRYRVTILHARDDITILPEHSNVLYWRAVAAAQNQSVGYEEFSERKDTRLFGKQGGWFAEHRSNTGVIRQEMLPNGGHNRIVTYPAASAAVLSTIMAAAAVADTKS